MSCPSAGFSRAQNASEQQARVERGCVLIALSERTYLPYIPGAMLSGASVSHDMSNSANKPGLLGVDNPRCARHRGAITSWCTYSLALIRARGGICIPNLCCFHFAQGISARGSRATVASEHRDVVIDPILAPATIEVPPLSHRPVVSFPSKPGQTLAKSINILHKLATACCITM